MEVKIHYMGATKRYDAETGRKSAGAGVGGGPRYSVLMPCTVG